MNLIKNIKYKLIKLLSGDMPVMLNMTVYCPKNFKGAFIFQKASQKGGFIFNNNFIRGKEKDYIIIATVDLGE